jgi:endonuclease YncB( thermonuclease family)
MPRTFLGALAAAALLIAPAAAPAATHHGGKRAQKKARTGRVHSRTARAIEASAARLLDVVDGDTVVVSTPGGPQPTYTVHLIGIEAPRASQPGHPAECGGLEAKSALLGMTFSAADDTDHDGLLETAGGVGARVRIRTDASQGLRDDSGELLGYVDVVGDSPAGANARFDLGQAMLDTGWAKIDARAGAFARRDVYRAVSHRAHAAPRGAWALCAEAFHAPVSVLAPRLGG